MRTRRSLPAMALAILAAVISPGAAGPADNRVEGAGANATAPAAIPPEVQQTILDQVGRGEIVAVRCVEDGTRVRFLADVRVGREDRRYYICECGAIAQIDIRSLLDDRRMLEDQGGRVIELTRVVSYGDTFYRAVVKGRGGVRMLRVTPAGDLSDRREDESDKLPKSNIA